jgi:site-specific DNA recombinase
VRFKEARQVSGGADQHAKQAVIRARVSSKEQAEGYSIPAQLDLLRDYATRAGITVVKEFIDVETSKRAGGGGFSGMIRFLKDHPDVGAILCEKTDRLYRNFRDYVTIDDLDVAIHLVREGEVLSKESKSHQKFIHGIKVLMAKNYIDNLSEEVKKGMTKKAESGTWPSRARIGYLNVQVGDKRKIDVDPPRSKIIIQMFQWYASGRYSLEAIRQMVTDAGLLSRRGNRLSKSRVESILKDPFYTGVFVWRGITYDGDHPAIISGDLFMRAQETFLKRGSRVRPTKRSFAYTGLIVCSFCGCAVTAEMKKSKYIYYHCTGARGGCKKPSIRQDALERELGRLVAAIEITPAVAEWLKEALRESHVDKKAYHDRRIAALSQVYARLQHRLDQIYLDKLDGRIGTDFWAGKSAEWRDEQRRIMAKIREHEGADHIYLDEGIQIIELAQRACSLWVRQKPQEKRRLLDILLSNCAFDGVTLYPTYRKPFCWLVNMRDRPVELPKQDSNPLFTLRGHGGGSGRHYRERSRSKNVLDGLEIDLEIARDRLCSKQYSQG